MVSRTFTRLRFIGLYAAIVPLLALMSGADSLWQNWMRVRSLHQLTDCMGASFLANAPYRIWTGVPEQSTVCAPAIEPGVDPAFAVFAAWLNGTSAEMADISRIQPPGRREIFAWRNRSQASLPEAYDTPESPMVAQFVAHLSVEAWRIGQRTLAVTLAQAVMAGLTPEVADILASGIAPRQHDEFLQFAYIREQIGRQLPDRAVNYVQWFEAALHYQQWSSAEDACSRLRRYAQTALQSQAAVCQARLAFYQGDYATAFAELKQVSQSRPADPLAWMWLGLSAKQLGFYVDAEDAFRQAIAYQDDAGAFLSLYWHLGDCQRALGKNKQARQSYQMALSYDRSKRYHSELELLLEQVQ